MHRLERRVAMLEPRAIRDEGISTGAKERLLERMQANYRPAINCPADASRTGHRGRDSAGAPCSDADRGDFGTF